MWRPSGLERWLGQATGWSRLGSNPSAATSLRNFGNSVYPALPVSFGGDTKSRRSLLSGVYARGSKRSHQSALECVNVLDSTTHSKLPPLWHWHTASYTALPNITQDKMVRVCEVPNFRSIFQSYMIRLFVDVLAQWHSPVPPFWEYIYSFPSDAAMRAY